MELFLPGFTAKKGVAVLIDPEAEVLTGHADLASFPTLELPSSPKPHHSIAFNNSTAVLLRSGRDWLGTHSNEVGDQREPTQNTTRMGELRLPSHNKNDGMEPEFTSILLLTTVLACWFLLKKNSSSKDKQTQEDIWHLSQGWKKWWRR